MSEFPIDVDALTATIARLLAGEGATAEVAILANAQAQIDLVEFDEWDGGQYGYCLVLSIPAVLYRNIAEEQRKYAIANILSSCNEVIQPYYDTYFTRVIISPIVEASDDWREKANEWLKGLHISNQGRVRSDNIASRTSDGLLFRSPQEINLYKALKAKGVSFAPLPVFIRGGREYRRIEPDFVLLKEGVVLIVEVDGDTVHNETPAEAHDRTTMLVYEGAFVERVKASECATLDLAHRCADKLLEIIEKYKGSR